MNPSEFPTSLPEPSRGPVGPSPRRALGPLTVLDLLASLVMVVVMVTATAVVPTLVIAALAGPATAQAGFDCDAPVIDTSGRLDVDAVRAAMDEIEVDRVGPEARVVVRVWDQSPSTDLVAAVDELVDRCFDDGEGGVDDQVAILSLTTSDLALDVLLGAGWALAVEANHLQVDVMTPSLLEGDATGAMVAALDDMAASVAVVDPAAGEREVIEVPEGSNGDEAGDGGGPPAGTDEGDAGDRGDGQAVAEEGETDGGDSDGDAPSDTQSDVAVDAASDESAAGERDPGASALVLGLIGLVGCLGVVVLVGRWRDLTRARIRLARWVDSMRGRMLIALDRDDRIHAATDEWYRTTAGRTRTAIGTEVRQARIGREAVERAAGLLRHEVSQNPGRADRGQIERARELGAELSHALSAHGEALARLAALAAHLDHLRVALPAKAELLTREVSEVEGAVDRQSTRGWPADDARRALAQVQAVVDEANRILPSAEVDLLALSDELGQAEVALFATAQEVGSQPGRETSQVRWADRLVDATDHEMNRVDDLRRQLAAAARTQAPPSWRWAIHHPELATEAVDRSLDLQSEAVDVAIPARHLDEAAQLLDRAGRELIRADDLLNELDDLLVDLDRARAEAPAALAQSRQALAGLASMLDQHPGEAPVALTRRHDDLADLVAALDDELLRGKSDHRQVVETAEQVGAEIDELVLASDDQRLVTEALLREVDRQTVRAGRAVARARRSLGWQLSASADGAILDRLEANLVELPRDPRAGAKAAAELTDAALQAQERILARRRRAATGVALGSAVSTSGHNGLVVGPIPAANPAGIAVDDGSPVDGPSLIRSRRGRSFGGRPRSKDRPTVGTSDELSGSIRR